MQDHKKPTLFIISFPCFRELYAERIDAFIWTSLHNNNNTVAFYGKHF